MDHTVYMILKEMPEFKKGFEQLHEYESSSSVIEVWQSIIEGLINKLFCL